MQFVVQSQKVGGIAVIHCEGPSWSARGFRALQEEVEKHSLETKKYVLDLGAVSYLDSGALGALVRPWARSAPTVAISSSARFRPRPNILRATNLHGVFCIHDTEKDASQTSRGGRCCRIDAWSSNARSWCIDPSSDLLAYLASCSTRGFHVKTTRYLAMPPRFSAP